MTEQVQAKGSTHLKVRANDLYLGDSLEVMKSFPAKSFDVTFTSPPFYDADLRFGTSKKICEHDPKEKCPYYHWHNDWIKEAARVTRNWIVAFNSAEREKFIHRCSDPLYTWHWVKSPSQYRNKSNPIFVYDLKRRNILSGAWSTVYWERDLDEIPGEGYTVQGAPVRQSEHPYEDPAKVYHEFLYIFAKIGCTSVLDPFVGRGTTLEACEKLGLVGTGIEINPDSFEMAVRRLSSGTHYELKESYKPKKTDQMKLDMEERT